MPPIKVLALISGGLDSPVAAYMVGRSGVKLEAAYFNCHPYLPESEIERVKKVCLKLAEKVDLERLHLIPHGENLRLLIEKADRKFTCILCKRLMLKISSQLALKQGFQALVTGDSLGQVASQTVANLKVEDEASSIPVLRPLLGLNKEEIASQAREIGTYQISTANPAACRAAPRKPATKAKLEQVKAVEEKLPLNEMVAKALAERRIFNLGRL
ncbi:MAG: tRNA sulfurtransferase [Candidatus Hecatellaceae archaeon]